MNQEKIGKFILELRKEKNMTQMDLADKIGVTDRAVSKWENGKGMPDLSLMQPLCKELGITINDLLSGEKIDNHDDQEKFEESGLDTGQYSNEKMIKCFGFYIGVFFSGIFVIPTLGVVAPVFTLCAIIAPLGGLVKLIGYIFNFSVPFVSFQIGNFELEPISGFILSVALGLVLYLIGKGAGNLLLKYIKYVKNKRIDLES